MPPIQLYDVPEHYVRNYEAHVWNSGEELNWPEPFIKRCVEIFRKERKFPGAIRLTGRLAEYKFPPGKPSEGVSRKQPSNLQPDLQNHSFLPSPSSSEMSSAQNSSWTDPTTYFQGNSRRQESGSNPPSRTVPGLRSPQTFADKGIVFRRFMASLFNKKPVSRREPLTSASESNKEPSLRFSELRRAEEERVIQLCLDSVASGSGTKRDTQHPESRESSSSSSTEFQSRCEDTDTEESETSSET